MANQKNYWYVIVLTNYGPVFVTGIPEYHTAKWDKAETPREFTKSYAQDLALGLCVNGYIAYAVCQPFKITHQPYRYDLGEFRFERTDNRLEDVVSWIAEHDGVYADFKERFPKLIEEEE